MPSKYSQSEAVLSFFEASHLDLMIGNNLDPTQLLLYSPITISEIRRSNGFCLANTETIICDTCPPPEISLPIGSMGHVYEKTSEAEGKRVLHTFSGDHDKGPNPDSEVIHIMKTEANPIMKPPRQGIASEVYMSKMTYLHMEAHETDILE
ncbi:PX domain-containing protein 1-like [Sardina pilchardus]|uniref:PX domain-containing protein 1-like n=1 Tax=Sardina pilchardus TaxID=27697 RepID=UPI002E12B39D